MRSNVRYLSRCSHVASGGTCLEADMRLWDFPALAPAIQETAQLRTSVGKPTEKGLNLGNRLLGKLASFALLATAGASLLFVTWLTHPSFGRTNEGEIRFRKESSHSKPQV